MHPLRDLWTTRPKSNRLAYYSFIVERALFRGETEIREDVEVEYRGARFLVPKGRREALYSVYLDYSEPRTYKLMTGLSGGVFVDVGANVGGYTVRLGKRFRNVISIEPNPVAVSVLMRNILLNGLSNVHAIQEAVSDTVGEVTMFVPASGKTTRSSIVERFVRGSSFTVHTSTLDSLLLQYDKIDLIKIDVEGAEVMVLKGAEETLQKTSRLVMETDFDSERKVKEILDGKGFDISDLETKERAKNIAAVKR